MAQNPYILAADNSPALLPLLRASPSLASQQDEHGYSLVHAAASYGHLDLLRTLVRDFRVPVDLCDEDGETALFVVETPAAARCLVEELGLDDKIKNEEGITALEKLEGEGEDEFPEVVAYLRTRGSSNGAVNGSGTAAMNGGAVDDGGLPPVPEGLSVTMVGTMAEPPEGEEEPELRRRVRELAARTDLQSAEGQAELRRLVEEALVGQDIVGDDGRSVQRQRQD